MEDDLIKNMQSLLRHALLADLAGTQDVTVNSKLIIEIIEYIKELESRLEDERFEAIERDCR